MNVKATDNKDVLKEVERMQKGRDERNRIKKFTERGIILQNNNHKQVPVAFKRPLTTTNKSAKTFNSFASPKNKDSFIENNKTVS